MKRISLVSVLLLVVLVITSSASAQGYNNLPGEGWWTGQQVQNVGGAEASVHILAYDKNSTQTYEATEVVGQGAAFTFTPFTSLPLAEGLQGSAMVFADQPIKAMVNVTNNKVDNPTLGINVGVEGGTAAGQYQGTERSSVAKKLYFPLAKGSYYNNTTTYYIQNAGQATATFSATFRMSNGDVHTYETPAVAPGRIAVFSVFDSDFDMDPLVENSLDEARKGGLIVTSDVPMAGVVMEHATVQNPAKVVYATRGFTANDFDSRAYAPVIKNMFYGAYTGIQVQNVNEAGAIDVEVTYHVAQGPNAGETIIQRKEGIPAGTSYTFVQLANVEEPTLLPMENLASVVIEATGGEFVAIVNETNGNATAGITYSALPDRLASRRISAPLFKDYYYGATSGLQIQNVGTITATNVIAEFSCGVINGSPFTARSQPQEIGPGSTVLFFRPSGNAGMFQDDRPFADDRANCAVSITGDQNVVAIVNEMGVEDGYGMDFSGVDDNNYEGFNLP
ncbi:MAG: hypothetical protein ACLFTI_05745 [Anaerolineales bacterium]